MRGDTCPVASGMGDGTRIRLCREGLAGACQGSWGESVFYSSVPLLGLLPHQQSFANLKLESRLGVRGFERVLAPVRLGGKMPLGKWESDTLGGTRASCCFPFSNMQVCKILMQSHLRKQINPFICESLVFLSLR